MQGIYYKVVDSDDWLDKDAYLKLLRRIKDFCINGRKAPECDMPDLLYVTMCMIILTKEPAG